MSRVETFGQIAKGDRIRENPVFSLKEYGIVFLFGYQDCKPLYASSPVLESVERDILAYAYRDKRPFYSEPIPISQGLNSATIEFPALTYYVAEGKTRVLIAPHAPPDSELERQEREREFAETPPREREFDICAFRTVFEGGSGFLHLGFVPRREQGGVVSETSTVDEYDVIKMLKLWEGGEGVSDVKSTEASTSLRETESPRGAAAVWKHIQDFAIGDEPEGPGERVKLPDVRHAANPHPLVKPMSEQLRILVADGEHPTTVDALARTILSDAGVMETKSGPPRLLVGTIQLQVGKHIWGRIYERLRPLHSKAPQADKDFCEAVIGASNKTDWKELLSLQGILCGLLNVDLADDAEMRDSFLLPMNLTGDAMLAVNKGTMLMVSDECRLGTDLGPTLGVNPFLSIPHAVLAFNESLLRDALEKATRTGNQGGSEGELQSIEVRMRKALQERFLPNIFHYSRERLLFDHGVECRRLRELERNALQRMEGINGTLDELRESKNRSMGGLNELTVLTLTLLQVIGNYQQLYHLAREHFFAFWSFAIATVISVTVVFLVINTQTKPMKANLRLTVFLVAGIAFWFFLYLWLLVLAPDFDDPNNPLSRPAAAAKETPAGPASQP